MEKKYPHEESSVRSLETVREGILNKLLITITIIALPPLVASLYRIVDIGWQNIMYFHVIGYLGICITAILHKKILFYHKALITITFGFLIGCIATVNMGLIGSGVIFMLFSIILATMFIGVRYGGVLIIVCLALLVIVALGVNQGWILFDFDIEATAKAMSSWISRIFTFILFTTMLIVSLGRLITYLVDSSNILKERTVELKRTNEKVINEITEKKRTEKALKKSEEKYRLLAENATDVIWTADLNLNMTYVSPSVQRVRGYTVEEIMSQKVEEQLTPDSLASATQVLDEELEKEVKEDKDLFRSRTLELESRCKDGSTHWGETKLSFIRDSNGKAIGILGVGRDIKDRKQAEEALKDSEIRYGILFESARDGIYVHDLNGNILDVNRIQYERLGYTREEYLKLNIKDIVPSEIASLIPERVQELKKSGNMVLESFHIRKDGTNLPIETNSSLIEYKGKPAILAIIRDISERKRAEEERAKLEALLQQAQRMESIGTLAGGIAHDFNNLLMGIQGNASMLSMDIDPNSLEYEMLSERVKNIEKLVQSGSGLTRQLLGFARRGKIEIKPVDLNDLVKKSSDMFERAKKEISIHTKFNEDLWSAEVDKVQIEQVLLNLYVNAWQAMPAGGDLFLETRNVTLDRQHVEPYRLEPGGYVKISVTDTGPGMDEATKQRIFEPFFTTKEMGRGTGLGLASAYGIIKNHSGIIEVSSKKGEGTTFNIYLPASENEVVEEKELFDEIEKGTERILFVDDEDMNVEVSVAMLEKVGYSVITAKSGREGLEIYERMKDEIDIVILDMIMPNMSGGETFDKLKTINPEIKVLLSSGYSLDGQATEILNRGCNGFIQKPYSLKELSQKIRDILDEK